MSKRNLILSAILASAGLIAYVLVDLMVPSEYYKMGMAAFYQKSKYKEARRLFRKVPEGSEDYTGVQIQLKKMEPILYSDSVKSFGNICAMNKIKAKAISAIKSVKQSV